MRTRLWAETRPGPQAGRLWLRLERHLDLCAEHPAVRAGNETAGRLAATGRVAAVVDAEIGLPLPELPLPVVIDADGEFTRFMEVAEGVLVDADRAGDSGEGGRGEVAVAVNVAAVAADPRPAGHDFPLLGHDEVTRLQHHAVIK